jgi:predicted AlkP superfamily phosphohydrolase/phosphomutase
MYPTVLIGLDGATFSVLDPLIERGHMPRLQTLLAGGVRARLKSTAHPLTPPAWTTLITGRNPGEHGIFDFVRHQVCDSGVVYGLNGFDDIKAKTIWQLVSEAGGSSLSLNFPMMAPPPPLRGDFIPGQISSRHLRRSLHPPELYDELKSIPGFNAVELSWDFEKERKAVQYMSIEDMPDWIEAHIRRDEQWFRIADYLMAARSHDLVAVLFDGVDKLQHAVWRFLDPKLTPQRPTPLEARVRRLGEQYFEHLDRFIGQIVDRSPPEARILLASDHGFCAQYTLLRVNTWLAQQGYLAWPASKASETALSGLRMALDWQKTVAYVPSAAANGIYIRVSRTPGEPGVSPDRYAALCAELTEKLLSIVDPRTGGSLVRRVLTKAEAYAGRYADQAPDLTLVLADHGFVSALDGDSPVWTYPQPVGTHHPDGILIASGPDIRQSHNLAAQRIVDVCPTLLHSLGLPVPTDLDGRAIDLFEPQWMRMHPVQNITPRGADAPPVAVARGTDLGSDDDEQVFQRLRALGYLE